MAYYYKINNAGMEDAFPLEGIQVYEENEIPPTGPSLNFDFSKHVLIELLDNITPETKLWEELGLTKNMNVVHKRLMVDSHRVNCRRAIVICSTSEEAKLLTQRLSQSKIVNRCVCAIVVQELLSDIHLFEKQIMHYGDKKTQQQLIYVTDLNRCREPSGLAQYLRKKFSPFGTILSVLVSEDKDGYAFPEAVIRFAFLSEAFAAELAYDQYVVGMERLSVTTHHNILLSQCDLRARLREAQLRFNNDTYTDMDFLGTNSKNHSEKYKKNSDINRLSLSSVRDNSEPDLGMEVADIDPHVDEGFPSDSAEMADVLQNSCQEMKPEGTL